MENLEQCVIDAVTYIKSIVPFKPDIAVILGSRLNSLAYDVQNPIEIPYDEIPYFKSSYDGDVDGKLVFGKIYDKNVVVMKGKLHYYEGYSMEEIAFPVRVFAMLGVADLIITGASGSLSPKLRTGDIVLITDHINMSFDSPLRGKNCSLFGDRFPSMKNCYSPELINLAKKVSYEIGINLQEGIFAFMPGPQYETAAEVRMLSTLGATCVGMSTVPEVIAAVHSGIDVLGISCITNIAGDVEEEPLHNEVLETSSQTEEKVKALVMDTIKKIVFNTEG